MANSFHHEPVLLEACLEHLHVAPGARVVDGTLGGGGHASAILERIGETGVLVGLDRDREALAAAEERFRAAGLLRSGLHLIHGSFRDLDSACERVGVDRVDAVLLDLGVSSWQLDAAHRGFRFGADEGEPVPLDMRMNPEAGRPASELLRRASAAELETWFREYGELPGAARLARAIVERRAERPLETSADLLSLIRQSGVGRGRRHNPATLVFQALRIAVNDELGALESGLDAALRVLRPGGRLVVIAYHSLEDRIVKHRFRAEQKGCICVPTAPVCTCGRVPRVRVLTRRPVRPDEDEIERNPRSRSARLRAAERVAEAA